MPEQKKKKSRTKFAEVLHTDRGGHAFQKECHTIMKGSVKKTVFIIFALVGVQAPKCGRLVG